MKISQQQATTIALQTAMQLMVDDSRGQSMPAVGVRNQVESLGVDFGEWAAAFARGVVTALMDEGLVEDDESLA